MTILKVQQLCRLSLSSSSEEEARSAAKAAVKLLGAMGLVDRLSELEGFAPSKATPKRATKPRPLSRTEVQQLAVKYVQATHLAISNSLRRGSQQYMSASSVVKLAFDERAISTAEEGQILLYYVQQGFKKLVKAGKMAGKAGFGYTVVAA